MRLLRAAVLASIPFVCLAAACGSTGTDEASGSATGGRVTGAGGAGFGHVSSSGVVAPNSGSTGGAGGQSLGHGAPYPIVLAHGFFGFNDFAGLDFVTYFYNVRDTLTSQGEVVYTPAVDPFNDSDTRGKELLEAVKQILAETGAAKVNIIGHSQGGLDARVVANLRPDLVASVVTIGTPHEGTPVADVVLQLVSDPNYQSAIDDLVKVIGAPLWDKEGKQSSVFKPLKLFSQPGIQAFNAAHPDQPGILYASLAGRSALHDDDSDCSPDTSLPFISQWDDTLDPVDPLLSVTALICQNGFDDDANDGLIPVKDAKRGEFWGCVPADHLDEIGQLLGDSPGIGNDWNYLEFYSDLVRYIRTRGY